MRFLAEANLRQIIRREEQHVDPGDLRAQLNDRIRDIFKGRTFDAVCFAGGPFDVPDEVGDGRPKLVVLGYEGVTVGGSVDTVPELIARIHARKGPRVPPCGPFATMSYSWPRPRTAGKTCGAGWPIAWPCRR